MLGHCTYFAIVDSNGTLGSGKAVQVSPGTAHIVAGTGAPVDASTADVVVNVTIPSTGSGAIGVNVLANVVRHCA
eukprot:SAG11_NODE_26932_length_339_cov_0.641667_1_plen_74_part_10